MTDERRYLTTAEAAGYLGLAAQTLKRYRSTGEGPVYHLFGGRVRYLREDLDAWAAERRRVSTVDDGTAERARRRRPAPDAGSGPRPGPAGADR